MAITDDRVTVADQPDGPPPRRVLPGWVALLLVSVALAAGAVALYYAGQARQANAAANVLNDGVDRSGLPRDEAVALALLARSRSDPVAHDEMHMHHHNAPTYGKYERTPEEQAVFDEQWAAATGAVGRFDTLAEAEALGYVQASGRTDGVGMHYVKWSLVDRPFDPALPSMLLFEELTRGEEPALIAYSYWVASDGEPEGFAGGEDSWHRHLGVCFVNGMIKDENLSRDQCAGDWINGSDLWMLHAWVVPGIENEYGRFHNVNPLLCEHACGLEN